jgi:hypothetical protein
MTTKEVLDDLSSKIKPYIGICNQSYYSGNMIRIRYNLAKPSTIEKFFNKFGYKKIGIDAWEKK